MAMDVKHRIVQFCLAVLICIGAQLLLVFVHCLGDHIEMHPLGGLGLLVHKIRQALGIGVAQPFVDRHAIARCFRDFLTFFIQKQLIGKMFRRALAQNATDFIIDRRVGRMVLAIHLEIDA